MFAPTVRETGDVRLGFGNIPTKRDCELWFLRTSERRGEKAATVVAGESGASVCCMVVWCALATAVLVASTHAFTPRSAPCGLACPSVEGLGFGSSIARRPTSHQLQHMQGGLGLWARRRSVVPARLSPAETGVPEVAARPDVKLDHTGTAAEGDGDGGSPPGSKKLTERGGLLLLATVPLVWGTYGASVKLLYQMGDSPPGLVFNFACYAVSAMTLAIVASFSRAKGQRPGVCRVLLSVHSPAVLISPAALACFQFEHPAGRSHVLVQPSKQPLQYI